MTRHLEPRYDFIVCGSGSSGSVVARRLAENPDVTVLLLEAGGTDDVPEVTEPINWALNLGSERDWGFMSQPSGHLNDRSILLSMGKVLGGGSSINAMAWARGHRNDWDYFAAETGDAAWEYRAMLDVYRRIEDWHGAPDPRHRGMGGPMVIQPARHPNPLATAAVAAADSVGIPTYSSNNGAMMEQERGAALLDLCIKDGRRLSVFRSYVMPYADRPNLTVLSEALVTRVLFDGNRATGVRVFQGGTVHAVSAAVEIVLSLGAVHTPKILMQSGVGNACQLNEFAIPIVSNLPGVGENYQDHPRIDLVWEHAAPLPPSNSGTEATLFWKSDPALDTPDLQICVVEFPLSSAENKAIYGAPQHGWTLCLGVVRPKSRGRIRLTGADPRDPVVIESKMLAHPDDVKALLAGVKMGRDIGNSTTLQSFSKREVMPGDLNDTELVRFVRDAAMTYAHHAGTAKMGKDDMSVVDGSLKVFGVERLRIADASIMPRITTGNTMAPCVAIGERAATIIKVEYGI